MFIIISFVSLYSPLIWNWSILVILNESSNILIKTIFVINNSSTSQNISSQDEVMRCLFKVANVPSQETISTILFHSSNALLLFLTISLLLVLVCPYSL